MIYPRSASAKDSASKRSGRPSHSAQVAAISAKDFIARMQTMGCDMNPTSYSKLEGQVRSATDKEIFVIAKILKVKMEDLFLEDEQ